MKTINVTFTDREFNELRKEKDKLSGRVAWHDFILRAVRRLKK